MSHLDGKAAASGPHAFTREETYAATRRPVALAATLVPDAYTSEEFFALERDRSSRRAGSPSAVRPSSASPATSSSPRSPGARSSSSATRTARCARSTTCAATAARGCSPPASAASSASSAARTTAGPTTTTARCVGTPLFTGSDIPADQQAAFDMHDVARVRPRRLRPAARRRRRVGAARVRQPRPRRRARSPTSSATCRRAPPATGSTSGRSRAPAEYEIAANYKLVAENFMEYYHLPWVHPGLVKVSPIEAHHRWQGPGMYAGFCTTPIAPDTDDGGWQSGLAPISGPRATPTPPARGSSGCSPTSR